MLDGGEAILMRGVGKLERTVVRIQRDIRQTGLRVRGHQPDTRGGRKALPPRGRPPVQPKVAYHNSSIGHSGRVVFNTPACSHVPMP